MRTLVAVFLLAMAVCVCASAQSQPPMTSNDAPAFFSSPAVPDPSADKPFVKTFTPELLPGLSLKVEPARKYTLPYDRATYLFGAADCFTMRSYIVRRESTNSDVTEPAGYTECTPASRVKMKSAVLEAKDPDANENK